MYIDEGTPSRMLNYGGFALFELKFKSELRLAVVANKIGLTYATGLS